jgi:hypothetical protein
LSLCFNWAPSHEGVSREWRYSSTHSSTSALGGGEWSASRPYRFTPKERAPGTHWLGGWVGPRTVLDAVMKKKIPSPRWQSNPRTPIVQPVAQRYTGWAMTAFNAMFISKQILSALFLIIMFGLLARTYLFIPSDSIPLLYLHVHLTIIIILFFISPTISAVFY